MRKRENKIHIGLHVGILAVEADTEKRKNGYTIWRCRCACGGEIELDTRTLQRGTVTDCGCRSRVRPGMLDLTGQRFGKLTCLRLADVRDKRGNTQWECRCDCGNLCLAAVPQLRAGYKKSCGCMSHPPLKKYVGQRFGMLTVLEYVGKENGMHRWKCLCDCGKETVVGQTLLQTGKTRSCGCRKAEQLAENLGLVDGTSLTMLMLNKDRAPIQSNTSGHNGVYQNKKSGKWIAQIGFKGKNYYLGSFASIEEAVSARRRGEELYEAFLEENLPAHTAQSAD